MNIIKKFPIFALSGLLLIGSTQLSAQLPWQQLIAPSLLVLAAGATGFTTHKALSNFDMNAKNAKMAALVIAIGSPFCIGWVARKTGYEKEIQPGATIDDEIGMITCASLACNSLVMFWSILHYNG